MRHHSSIETSPVGGRCRARLRHTGLDCLRRARHPLPVCGIHELAIRQRPARHRPELVSAVKAARRQHRLGEQHTLTTCPPLADAEEVGVVVDHVESALVRVDLVAVTAPPGVDDYALGIARRCAIRAAVCRALMQIDQGRRDRAGRLRLVQGGAS